MELFPVHKDLTCRLSIQGYIELIVIRFGHKRSTKLQISPHKHHESHYGVKVQVAPEEVTSLNIDSKGIKRVQAILVALLFYGRTLDKKMLVTLNTIVTQQALAT